MTGDGEEALDAERGAASGAPATPTTMPTTRGVRGSDCSGGGASLGRPVTRRVREPKLRMQLPMQLLLLLLLLLLLHGPAGPLLHGVRADCRLRLGIDPALSNFTLGGYNRLQLSSTNIDAPLKADGEYETAFVGSWFANATGDCPVSYADWAAVLPTLQLNTDGNWTEYMGVELYPTILRARTAGFAMDIRDFILSMRTTLIMVDAASGALRIEGDASALRGFVLSDSTFTGLRYDDGADCEQFGEQVYKGNFTGRGQLSVANGTAQLSLSDFNVGLSVVDLVSFATGVTYTSTNNLLFSGPMVMTAGTMCDVYCGDHGECVSSDNGTSGCVCECGWAGGADGACTVPSGYCRRLGALDGAEVVVVSDDVACPECTDCSSDYDVDFTVNGSDAAGRDEGAADIYRPVIAFAPLMAQVLLLAGFASAMAAAWTWMSPRRGDSAAAGAASAHGQSSSAGGAYIAAGSRVLADGKGARADSKGATANGGGSFVWADVADDAEPSAPPLVRSVAPGPVAEARHAADVVLQVDADGGCGGGGRPVGLTPVGLYEFHEVHVAVATSAMAIVARACGRPRDKVVLAGVSGAARAGQLTGLLGPSGSGKTTLINVLAGQVRSGGCWRVHGELRLDGAPVGASALSRHVAHVPQFDLLMPGLTVAECLHYAAACRLPGGRGAAGPREAHARVARVLRELDLEHLAGTHAASGAVISGGERKRVCIGMELVGDARLLLLDEPTSGLDSFNAARLVQVLRRVAIGDGSSAGGQGGGARFVLCSLHQPSPTLFGILDEVLLMARGRVVMAASPGGAADAMAALGVPCSPGTPIAEHLLLAVGDPDVLPGLLQRLHAAPGGHKSGEAEAHRRGGSSESGSVGVHLRLGTPSASPAASDATPAGLLLVRLPGDTGDGGGGGEALAARCVGLGRRGAVRSGLLLWRDATQLVRSPGLLVMHLLGAAAMGLLVGFTNFRQSVDTTSGVTGRLGTIFFTLQIAAFPSLAAMEQLITERPVATRELSRHWYSAGGYMVVKLLVDGLLLRALPSAVYTTLFYWIFGMRDTATAFTIALGVITAFTCCVGALVMCLVNLLGSPGRTVIVASVLLLIFALFGGFLVDKREITWVLRWICYVSPTRWAWEALAVNEIRPLSLSLTVEGVPGITNYPGGLFLRSLGVDPTMLTQDIAALSAWYGGIALCAIASMYVRMALIAHGWIAAE